jgi:hypothetical protein
MFWIGWSVWIELTEEIIMEFAATILRISRFAVSSQLPAVGLSLIVNTLLLWSINDLFISSPAQIAAAWVVRS